MSLDLGTLSGKVDLDDSAFQRKYASVDGLLDKLESRKNAEVHVGADVAQAERKLDGVEAFVSGVLDGMSAEVNVLADTSKAEAGLDDVVDRAENAGDEAGDGMGMGMAAGILAGLASIPIAGAVVKVGQAIAGGLLDGIQDGLALEATRDLFSARTGLDEGTASKFAAAAGEAYANAFGESVESNLDVARTALQLGIIDSDATDAEIQQVIAKIDTLSLLAEEDARRVATAVDVMVSNGIVKSADEAFDVLTRGFQSGVDSGEDLLDTFIEYPALMERLGLSADEAMGLLNQGLEAGARNSDFVADALKEFQIRATDASEASAKGFERIGLNAEEMTAKIAKGGPDAKEGLDQVLDGLRAMEDPVERNAAGVELFGTKWEDLGDSILALDVDTAVSSLGQVEGALDEAMTALADNPATAVESAKRNIEIAADGIKGSLATMFAGPLEELAEYVSTNRTGVLEFAGAVGNAFFDMAEAGVESSAMMIESIGKIPGALLPVLDYLAQTAVTYNVLADTIPNMPSIPMSALESIGTMREGIAGVEEGSQAAADALRDDLIGRGLDPLQDRFNEGLDVEIMKAQVHDAATALQGSIAGIGESLEDVDSVEFDLDGRFDRSTEAGAALDAQLRDAVSSLAEVQETAAAAGESQDSLSERWYAGRDALVAQLEAIGYTKAEAEALAEAYGAVPTQIETSATLDSAPARVTLGDLVVEIDHATGTVTVNGDKTPADTTLGELIGDVNASDGTVKINGNKYPADMTLESLLGKIAVSERAVTIGGNDWNGRAALGGLMSSIRGSAANVAVGANTWNARVALQGLINDFSGRVISIGSRIVGGAATGGLAGDVLPGFAGGGSPSTYPGGGLVYGPGTPISDDVEAKLSRDEFVQRAAAVDYYGVDKMYALNAMQIPREWLEGLPALAGGGAVGHGGYSMPAPSYSPAPAQPVPAPEPIDYGRLAAAMAGVQVHATASLDPRQVDQRISRFNSETSRGVRRP